MILDVCQFFNSGTKIFFLFLFFSIQFVFATSIQMTADAYYTRFAEEVTEALSSELFDTIGYLRLKTLDYTRKERRKRWFLVLATYVLLEEDISVPLCKELWMADPELQKYPFLDSIKGEKNEYILSCCRELMHEYEPHFFVVVREYLLDGKIPNGLTEKSSLLRILSALRKKYDSMLLEDILVHIPFLMVRSLFKRMGFDRFILMVHCLWTPDSFIKKYF